MKKWLLFFLAVMLPIVARPQLAFTQVGQYIMGTNSIGMDLQDVNHDGSLDLVVRNKDVLVLTNDGNGHFASNNLSAIDRPLIIRVGDINGDGYADLIGSDNGFPGHIFVYTNSETGSFNSNAVYNVGNSPNAPLIADINNDSYPDIVCPNAASKTLSVLTNDGSGRFQVASTPATGSDGNPGFLIDVDINNDGKKELICANSGNPLPGSTLSVLTNAGAGVFKLASTPGVGMNPGSVVAADINGDPWVDLVCANYIGKSLSVLTNNGSGGFASDYTFALGFSPLFVISVDLNGDGKTSLVCANSAANTLLILTNNGGVFGSNTTLAATRPYGLIAADINKDGKSDFVCINDGLHPSYYYTSSSSISVYENIPELAYGFVNNNLVLSWLSTWTNWVLVQNSDLSSTNWMNFSGTVYNDGIVNSTTNLAQEGSLFFRLSHP